MFSKYIYSISDYPNIHFFKNIYISYKHKPCTPPYQVQNEAASPDQKKKKLNLFLMI